MTGTTGSLSLFLLARLFLTVESQTGQVLPPQNLSLLWIEDYRPMLTWTQPQHSGENCTYAVVHTHTGGYNEREIIASPPWPASFIHEAGELDLSVQTVCDGGQSELTVLDSSYPEMVRNVQCYWYPAENASYFWEPAVPRTVVGFFYRVTLQDLSRSYFHTLPSLQECSSYTFTKGVRTGCELQVNLKQSTQILFNGTENKKLFRNTFSNFPLFDCTVKLPPLEWTVKKTGNKFNISWITPHITSTRDYFKMFVLNITECEAIRPISITEIEQTSTELSVNPGCRYRMAMQAVYVNFSTPWSEEMYFDAEANPNAWLYAIVLIPLMLAGLTALTFVCCREYIWKKNHIFPKVPQPRDFLTDISDRNHKSTACDLYCPAEEENCKLSLVMEPEIDRQTKLCSSDHYQKTSESLLSSC